MALFWHAWLYAPLLNLLIYLYDAIGLGSLGIAVIGLTVVIRLILLPLSILSEKGALAFDRLQVRIRAIEEEPHTDPVDKNERIRALLKENKVNPWAKVATLLLQLLVLVVLYQVFMGGINRQLGALYSWVERPENLNTVFLGRELGRRSFWWALSVGVFLFVEIAVSLKRRAHLERSDLYYLFLFPAFVLLVLWYLPMVKSLFIMTSMLFSLFLSAIRYLIFKTRPASSA
jgi:YidC/Oxa1 family membrane protein insertase